MVICGFSLSTGHAQSAPPEKPLVYRVPPSGETSLVVSLSQLAPERTLTVLNENLRAEGKLFLAVAEKALPANSSDWSQVEGAIAFRHKRLFKLSLVGIKAAYLRLTFDVTNAAATASTDDAAFRAADLLGKLIATDPPATLSLRRP